MSKAKHFAAQWRKFSDEQRRAGNELHELDRNRPRFSSPTVSVSVTDSGHLHLEEHVNRRDGGVAPETALALAKWINETFGDAA